MNIPANHYDCKDADPMIFFPLYSLLLNKQTLPNKHYQYLLEYYIFI